MGRPAVFLDRDGTINEDVSYLSDPDKVRVIPGAVEGLRLLSRAGFALVIVSNQSCVARGMGAVADVEAVNRRLLDILARQGVSIERVYYCPHHPQGSVPEFTHACDCRKPAPGMLLRAAEDADINLSKSYTAGDSIRDLEAGRAVGTRTLLVRTGYGMDAQVEAREKGLADFVADDLYEAAEWILNDSRKGDLLARKDRP